MAGEGEQAPDEAVRVHSPRKDSAVVTIGRVTLPPELLGEPRVEIVAHYWWTGRDHATQYTALLELLRRRWRVVGVDVDATGVGAGVASWLQRAMGDLVEDVVFTRPRKSELGYVLLSAIRGGRCLMYKEDGSAESEEFWKEMTLCRYTALQSQSMNFYVDDKDGHDDFVVSAALMVAAAAVCAPEPAGGMVAAPLLYPNESRY